MATSKTICETSLTSSISKNFADPGFFDKKIVSGENVRGFSVSSVESEVALSAIFHAVAIALSKEKTESGRKYLAFYDNEGGFIVAFWIEKDTTTESWEMGSVWEQADIEKVPEKDVIKHTDPEKFMGSVAAPFYYMCYTRGIGCASSELDNQIVLTVLLTLKQYLEASATEDGYVFEMKAKIPANMISPSLRAMNKDELEAGGPSADLMEDIGTVISKVGKTGVIISWECGESLKPYIKDDEVLNVMVESMSAISI